MRSNYLIYRLLTIILMFTPLVMNAELVFKTNENCAAPCRSIEVRENENKIVVTYEFSEITEVRDTLTNEILYHMIPGFGQCATTGMPKLPMRIDTFPIPQGCKIKIQPTLINGATIEDCNYIGVDAPLAESDTTQFESYTPIVPYSGFFPAASVKYLESYSLQGEDYCDIAVSPIQYDYENHVAKICKKLTYFLTFIPENIQSRDSNGTPIFTGFKNFFGKHMFTGSLRAYDPISMMGSSGPIGYIILSTDTFLSSIENFNEWKKTLGYRTYILSKPSWSSSEEVLEAVRKCRKNHKGIQYLLIVGDIDDVPSNKIPPKPGGLNKHYTDSKYGTIGDESYIPDIYIGRISVNASEASDVLAKIIQTEMCPVLDEDYYNKSVHCAYFQAGGDRYTESRRFIKTSEEIRDYMRDFDIRANRLYSADPESSPKFYNQKYSKGGPIPFDLTRGYFSWRCTSSEIAEKMNEGNLYWLYRGHSDVDGWKNVGFRSADLPLLINFEEYPVVFSITCLTGKFSEDCFAERLLRLPNSGASAVIAASEESFSGFNDSLIEGMFDAIWPEPGLFPTFGYLFQTSQSLSETPKPTYRLGQILEQGLFRMKEQIVDAYFNEDAQSIIKYQYELYHIFGDPSMYFHTKKPEPFSNVTIEETADGLKVSTHGEKATIAFYDPIEDSIGRIESDEASFVTDNPLHTSICITGHNRLPYLKRDFMEAIGDSKQLVRSKKRMSIESGLASVGISSYEGNLNVCVYNLLGSKICSFTANSCEEIPNLIETLQLMEDVYLISINIDGKVVETYKVKI